MFTLITQTTFKGSSKERIEALILTICLDTAIILPFLY